MEEKDLNKKGLRKLLKNILENSKENTGVYTFKDLKISIHLTPSYRNKIGLNKKIVHGLCIECGKKITKVNPVTKELYKRCDYHRKLDSLRNKQKRLSKKEVLPEELQKIENEITKLLKINKKAIFKKG